MPAVVVHPEHLDALEGALEELQRAACDAIPCDVQRRPVDQVLTREEVQLAPGVHADVVTVLDPGVEFELSVLAWDSRDLGLRRWPAGAGSWAVARDDHALDCEVVARWRATLDAVPYTSAQRATLEPLLARAEQLWSRYAPGEPAHIPAPELAAAGDPQVAHQLATLGATLARFADVNEALHVLGGHGKTWEPSASLGVRLDQDRQVRLTLTLGSYQLSHLTRGLSGERTAPQWEQTLQPLLRQGLATARRELLEEGCRDGELRQALAAEADDETAWTRLRRWATRTEEGGAWFSDDLEVAADLAGLVAALPRRAKGPHPRLRLTYLRDGRFELEVDGAPDLGLRGCHPTSSRLFENGCWGQGSVQLRWDLARAAALLAR